MFTLIFWKRTAERSIATAAQAVLASWGVDLIGILDVDWAATGSFAGLAFLAAVLKAVIASQVNDPESPSFVTEPAGRYAA